MKSIGYNEIISNIEISKNIMDMKIHCPKIAKKAIPGQFVNVYTGLGEYILPRPISICDVDKDKGYIRLIYGIVGKGTDFFSKLKAGDYIKVLGPLGNGFNILDCKKSILVGGGIGTPPMLYLAKSLKGELDVYLGARDSNILVSEFTSLGVNINLASDSGKEGFKGNVVELMKSNFAKGDVIYSCGPKIMLKSLTDYAIESNIAIEVSMEERMACGIGACVGCAIKIKDNNGYKNLKVCKDGPVFNGLEVYWD